MIRYFQNTRTHDVTVTERPHEYEADDRWVEVEVVPAAGVRPRQEWEIEHAVSGMSIEKAREEAVNGVRLWKYLASNPPLDEAQVQALGELIGEAEASGVKVTATDGSLERFLVKHGVRVAGGEAE